MTESKPLHGSDVEAIAIVDATAVGLAVLQAVLNLRRGERSELEIRAEDVTIRVTAHPATNRVVVFEV
jgi:hypothetical protein